MLITNGYREQNKQLHSSRADYGRGGHRWAGLVEDLWKQVGCGTILDYGCGGGTFKPAFGKGDVRMTAMVREYDPAIPGKDFMPEPVDIVVCTDVLEHIEPDCLDAVLDHLQSLARKAAFLVISTRSAKKTLPDGRNAHLIQQKQEWWLPKLMERFTLIQFNDSGGEILVIAVPKKSPILNA